MPKAKMSMERRLHPRINVKIPVKYRLEEDAQVIKTIAKWRSEEKNAYTLDMSLGGMSIVVDKPLSAGEFIKFEVYLLDKKNLVTIYAAVRWADKKSAGVRFLMMKNEDLDALKAFLEKSAAG